MFNTFLPYVIATSILVTQHYLSIRPKGFWGAILPSAYIITFISGGIYGLYSFSNIGTVLVIGMGGTSMLLGIWLSGRQKVANKYKKE
ncbi:hypothetical protein J2S78_003052 [Salibacterium salarium]|uniref:hypothetical protein n=1 Tax=Salibacterium salarium TaxID=284579 RepID=UPI002783349E|nr:hypothetical protein [Salibacterium salarium]MDQ0300584.1 hypothetical protein [Salibacterium salarium]